MRSCRYPGCPTEPRVLVSEEEAWCKRHARSEADRLLRAFVLDRDRRICQRCGGGAHDAAHLIGRGRAPFIHWELENVVALCRPCHVHLDEHPAERDVWIEARFPGVPGRLRALQARAEGQGRSVDLAAVIRGFGERDLTPAEMAAYKSGAWIR